MAEIKRPVAYRVDIIESERGWGQKLDESRFFDTEADALSFCKKYNACNTEEVAPDWYMQANYIGRV